MRLAGTVSNLPISIYMAKWSTVGYGSESIGRAGGRSAAAATRDRGYALRPTGPQGSYEDMQSAAQSIPAPRALPEHRAGYRNR